MTHVRPRQVQDWRDSRWLAPKPAGIPPVSISRETTMTETSASIAQWQNETFGPATTTEDRLDRSRSAMEEAFAKVNALDLSNSVPRPNLSRAIRAAEELAELIETLVADDSDPAACTEVADVSIVLDGIPAFHGHELTDDKTEKMAVNRARTWSTTGDGHGQHVKEVK